MYGFETVNNDGGMYRLTQEQKRGIRRNEQMRQEMYDPPKIFRLIRVGEPRLLEQGEVVLGKVKVVTTKRIACQVIFVEFRGLIKVDFYVPSTTMIDEIQNFKKEWEFFNHKIPVFMHEYRGTNFLEAGIYEFYFKARVPIGGPCTFITDIANVTYRFDAVFVRNDVTSDIYAENHLTYHVLGYKDLNAYPGARIGFWQEKITRVGGIFGLFSGFVKIKVKTDKRAYVPGEKIHIVGEVENKTWRKCAFHYELKQNVTMWGDHYFWRSDHWGRRHLDDSITMERGKSRVIRRGKKITLEETILIPKFIEPSYLGMSAKDYINDLIHLEYQLHFELDIPVSPNLKLTVPIIIGTEPFIFLPEPPIPAHSEESISELSLNEEEETRGRKTKGKAKTTDTKIQLEVLQLGKQVPFMIPRFHPLNKKFQEKFPESYRVQGQEGVGRGKRDKQAGGDHLEHCQCTKPEHKKKKRHRSTCRKNWKTGRGTGKGRVQTDYGHGLPLEECTYENWLAAIVEDYDDEDGKTNNMLLNVMRQYGLVS